VREERFHNFFVKRMLAHEITFCVQSEKQMSILKLLQFPRRVNLIEGNRKKMQIFEELYAIERSKIVMREKKMSYVLVSIQREACIQKANVFESQRDL